MPELVSVRVRDCAHPDTPHDGDYVYLFPRLSLEGGMAAVTDTQRVPAMVAEGMSVQDATDWLTRRMIVTFVRHGYAHGDLTVDELLADYELGMPVADAASDLYSEAVLRPLGVKPPVTSLRGQTDGSTSPTKRSTLPRRGRSSRPAMAGTR